MDMKDQKQVDETESKPEKELQLEKSGAELGDDELEQVSGGKKPNKSVCKYLM